MNTQNTTDTSPSSSSMPDENMTDATLAIELLADGLQPIAIAPQRESGLRNRLQNRVSVSAENHRGVRTLRHDDQKWQTLAKGVRACVLHDNDGVRSALVEFEPGSRLPSHRHLAHEECMVLRGGLTTGDVFVGAQDYHLALSGSKHPSITSDEGALIFLRGTSIGSNKNMLRELLSAWLPGRGETPTTVRASDDTWHNAGEGARIKPLWINGESASVLVSLAPGGRIPMPSRQEVAQDKEFLTIAGEAFVGDILLRNGEYQMAPRSSTPKDITSDVGGMLFVHTTAEFARLS